MTHPKEEVGETTMRARVFDLYATIDIATFEWHLLNDAQEKRDNRAPRGEGK